jgi:DNA-binding FrmR family transcriptional regulator
MGKQRWRLAAPKGMPRSLRIPRSHKAAMPRARCAKLRANGSVPVFGADITEVLQSHAGLAACGSTAGLHIYCQGSLGPYRTGPGFDTIPLLGSQRKMSHTSKEKLDLVNRTKKIIGQLESILRALNDDEQCADVLQRLAAARGAINSLMGELMEDHIRNHMPKNSKSSEEATDDLIGIVRTYLK